MSDLHAPHPATLDELSTDEHRLITLFRQLSEARKRLLLEAMEALVEHGC